MPETLSIGQLAKMTATSVETIRYYERIGLMPAPVRTAGNYRVYAQAHGYRLRFVRRARALGFSLEDVRVLLQLADHPERSCEDVDALARLHLTAVKEKIKDLVRLRNELEQRIAQCRHGTVADCRIIEALAPTLRGRSAGV